MIPSTIQELVQRMERTSASAEKKWPALFAVCCAFLLLSCLVLDLKKPFWNDELFTFYIARQPTLGGVWNALMTGAEQLPPFFFVIERSFAAVAAPDRLAFRLPETLGFLVMSMSIFWFVKRRSSALFALIGFLFPILTEAFYYASEARPYGLAMGFGGLSMVCWQAAVNGMNRKIFLPALLFCLVGAIGCHYYAVLLLVPFGLAEGARWWQSRRIDLAMYAALSGAVFPLIAFLPLIRAANHYSSRFWAKPSWTSLISFYEGLLAPAPLALLLMVLVVAAASWLRAETDSGASLNTRLSLHEIVLAIGFALIPMVAIVIAKFVTGAFTARYAIYAVIGVSILIAWSLARLGRGRETAALAAVTALLGCSLVIFMRLYQRFASEEAGQRQTFEFLDKASRRLPLVIASPHQFFVMSHRASIEHRGHFLYLADQALALDYTGTDTVERGLLALRNYAPLDVQPFSTFASTHQEFLLYGFPDPFGWVLEALMQSGHTVSVESRNGSSVLYLVRPPPKSRH